MYRLHDRQTVAGRGTPDLAPAPAAAGGTAASGFAGTVVLNDTVVARTVQRPAAIDTVRNDALTGNCQALRC